MLTSVYVPYTCRSASQIYPSLALPLNEETMLAGEVARGSQRFKDIPFSGEVNRIQSCVEAGRADASAFGSRR